MGGLHMRFVAWGILGLLCLAGPAGADDDQSINAVIKFAQKDGTWKELVLGAGSGLAAANAVLGQRGQPRLFCPPDTMSITADQYVSFLASYVKEHPQAGTGRDSFYSLVLLYAMKEVFPCK
ncbi:hypothetical protein QD357_01860 [Rhizobium sp. BR 317]|uniref:hypothetical protein n=1 Tax=Rhizobium sp. BR 317 TaxID=3040015 RepID=UPI0039BF09EA